MGFLLGLPRWSVAMMVLYGLRNQRVKPVIRGPGHAQGGEGKGVLRDCVCGGR